MAVNLQQIEREKRQIKNFLNSRIQAHFEGEFVDISKRTRVEADLEKWRPEIVEIWNQKEERTDRIYSIYFDDEFVCSFGFGETPAEVEAKFLKGLYDLVENDTVYLDENEYIIQAELARIKEKEEKEKIDKETKSDIKEVNQIIKELKDDS
jgi:hypothetical protein